MNEYYQNAHYQAAKSTWPYATINNTTIGVLTIALTNQQVWGMGEANKILHQTITKHAQNGRYATIPRRTLEDNNPNKEWAGSKKCLHLDRYKEHQYGLISSLQSTKKPSYPKHHLKTHMTIKSVKANIKFQLTQPPGRKSPVTTNSHRGKLKISWAQQNTQARQIVLNTQHNHEAHMNMNRTWEQRNPATHPWP